jgi:GT2 family glycosyltransferase
VQDFEIIVVDNGSGDQSVDYIQNHYPDVNVIALEKNFGFSIAVNAGIKKATGRFIVLLNNDTLPEKEWLSSLLGAIEDAPPTVGFLASLMVSMENPADTDDAGDLLDWYGLVYKRGHGEPISQWNEIGPVFSACAGAALYKREFLEKTGNFDEMFGSYLEDIDIGLRGNLFGYHCLFVPSARVLHKGHGSAIPSKIYVYHVTKNRVMLLLKNIPAKLLIRHLRTLLLGQGYSFFIYRHPLSSLRAYLTILWKLPAILRERRGILPHIVLSYTEIESMLQISPHERTYTGRIA